MHIADKLRETTRFTDNNLLQEGINANIILSYDELYDIKDKIINGEYLTPRIILDFVKEYLMDKKEIKVLDPWSRYGEIQNIISNTGNLKNIGLYQNEMEHNIAKNMLNIDNTQLIFGSPLDELDKLDGSFDLIASCPPFNFRKCKFKVNDIEMLDFESNLIILKSSLLLNENGIAFFAVPPSFFFKSSKNSIKYNLEKFGLYIDAAFYLPPGTFRSTSIPTYLIAISRVPQDKMFLAELSSSSNVSDIILNWKQRTIGEILSLGYLIEFSDFISYEKIVKEQEIKRLFNIAKLTPISMNSIVFEFNLENKNIDEGFEEKSNSIYLPLIGMSNAVSRIAEITLKPQNYIQLVLNPNNASAEYVANWFNSELGKNVRESLMIGVPIQRMSKTSIKAAYIYIPSLEIQLDSNALQSKINSIRSEINSVEGQLWKNPYSLRSLESKLRNLNQSRGLENWIEKLPFPLGSILWKYYATKDIKSKKDFLLYFFEALAQFEVVIMLSALKNDNELYANIDVDLEKFSRSTFGTWVVLGEHLAKTIRTLLSNENKDRCLHIFKMKKKDLVEIVSSKKVYQVLRTTRDYRNDWKGHGGIEGNKEAKNRLNLLETELFKIRDIFGDVFENTRLIKPLEGFFESGLYNCRSSLLMGTRSTFKEVMIKVMIGIERDKLYLIEEGNHEPLELLPFIKMLPSPRTEENTCYFYNRMDKEGARLISYYFERDAEITISGVDISNIFLSLNKDIKL